jgi:hypothetical protein
MTERKFKTIDDAFDALDANIDLLAELEENNGKASEIRDCVANLEEALIILLTDARVASNSLMQVKTKALIANATIFANLREIEEQVMVTARSKDAIETKISKVKSALSQILNYFKK